MGCKRPLWLYPPAPLKFWISRSYRYQEEVQEELICSTSIISRVAPWCSGFRSRRQITNFSAGLNSDNHTSLPLVPSSSRASGLPRYGSPTTFPLRAAGHQLISNRCRWIIMMNRSGIIPVDPPGGILHLLRYQVFSVVYDSFT